MRKLDHTLIRMFHAPFCPTCAIRYDAAHYDIDDDNARCPNCGTAYQIPAEYRPPHPEDAQEYNLMDKPQSVALEQFRADVERIAAAAMRATAGATYELYARQFSDACDAYIEDLEPALRHRAIVIANAQGYVEDEEVRYADFGPGLCSLTGIDEHYCHCGRHP
ncbi:MAG: hypothetical protein QM676_08525 [Novosphingobium sp.]